MEITYFVHTPENYGTSYRCYALAKNLSMIGFKMKMVCASEKMDFLMRKRNVNENFELITLPYFRFHRYFSGHSLRALLSSLRVIFTNPDIVHGFTAAQPSTAIPSIIWKKRGNALFVDWDDAWGGGFAEGHGNVFGKMLAYFEEDSAKKADEVTYVSEWIFERIKSLGIKNAHYIPNGSPVLEIPVLSKEECRRDLKIGSEEKILLSMGNLYTGGVDKMLNSFQILLKENPGMNPKLLFLGTDMSKAIEEKFGKEILKNIIFCGKKPFNDVKYYLGAADALLLPMEETNVEKARFPMRLGDYLCAGRPIVSNGVGEVKKVLEQEKCGLVSGVDDAKGFKENMLLALEDKEKSEELGGRAREAAEKKYDWRIIVKKLAKVYEKYNEKVSGNPC